MGMIPDFFGDKVLYYGGTSRPWRAVNPEFKWVEELANQSSAAIETRRRALLAEHAASRVGTPGEHAVPGLQQCVSGLVGPLLRGR